MTNPYRNQSPTGQTSSRPEIIYEIIYELKSVLDRLPLDALFDVERPLEVELGSGDGSFLLEYAKRHPERNFIGVERLLGRLRKLERKGRRAGVLNVRGVRIESSYFLEYLLPLRAASVLHLYFPDPWPKRKHRRHRLVNERFVEVARAALVPGGKLYLRTDDPDYFAQAVDCFAGGGFSPVETPEELAAVKTDFEEAFEQRGTATLKCGWQIT